MVYLPPAMPLTPGTRLGPYEILSALGAGGMGEVYRAKDTRLDRTVAIKVLPAHLSSNADLRQRFEREARAVSSLNHPNVCTLHDIGREGNTDFLVMELLEGETLAARLGRGPVPPAELLRYAVEIADALDRAHRSGILHRDLKPGNVMITKTGTKLLDFGLAKGITQAAASPLTAAPTATSPLTAQGTIVGTFQYMAPEQFEGKEADVRSDIFAFGTVLYEMATGKRAFEGKTQASMIAAILEREPAPITSIQPLAPAGLERVVKQCLAKDPDERWQSAGDLKRELKWIAEGGSQAGVPAPAIAPGRRSSLVLVTVVALLVAAGFAAGFLLRKPTTPAVLHATIDLPPQIKLDPENLTLALSPDGRTLAFTGFTTGGNSQIWIRPLDAASAVPLAGTEGATCPFWSPDGRYLGFFADRKLKKVPASGGTSQTLCDAPTGRGGTWSRNGVIVFAPGIFGGLYQIPAAGGTPSALTTAGKEGQTDRLPHFMPDGKHVLFYSGKAVDDGHNGIYALDLATKKISLVMNTNSEAQYLENGYIAYVREGNLQIQPFDPVSLRPKGDPVPIAEKVRFSAYRWTGAVTVSAAGPVIFQTGSGASKDLLTWYDLDGKKLATIGEPTSFGDFTLSPDGQRALVTLSAGDSKPDLWSFDLHRGVGSKFTFTPGFYNGTAWSPDGEQIAYSNYPSIFIKLANGASGERSIFTTSASIIAVNDWSPDGRSIVFSQLGNQAGWDLLTVPVSGGAPQPFLASPANEKNGRFSPDGKWLLYLSDETGRDEVYVVPYPGPGGKWQISSGGAYEAAWLGDGHQIAVTTIEYSLLAVDVQARGSSLAVGASHPLFGGVAIVGAFQITRDGKKILVASPLENTNTSNPLTIVTDWVAELQKK
ncbi:MAG: protein kinase [Acidobacteria bacterium]|nr:protein kinase [Acidobacteriota bacterium]